MSKQLIVIYRYKLGKNVKEQEFLRQHERVSDFLKARPGFNYCSLSRADDGGWVDINYWSDGDNLEAANTAFEKDSECAKFITQLDPSSIVMEKSVLQSMGQAV